MTSTLDHLDTLAVLRDGLDESRRLDVVVVGAGIAGLTAASLLHNAGHNVKVLEAQNRNGGRIYTHHYPDGRYAELGAMRYAPDHHHAHLLFEKYNMTMLPFKLEHKEAFLDGRVMPLAESSLRDLGFEVDRPAQELLDSTMAQRSSCSNPLTIPTRRIRLSSRHTTRTRFGTISRSKVSQTEKSQPCHC